MGNINFSTRGVHIREYGTNLKGMRFPKYDITSRSRIVKTVINGLDELPKIAGDRPEKILKIKACLSTSLKGATYRETGKIRESSVDQIVSSLYSHIIQEVGIKSFKAIGIDQAPGEDGLAYQKKVEAFLKTKIKSTIVSGDLISPTNALRVIKMLQAAGKLMAEMSGSNFKADGIFRMFQLGIHAVKIGDGMEVFVVDQDTQKVMNTNVGPDFTEPKAGIAHFLYINNLISRRYKEANTSAKGSFRDLLMKVKFWDGKWQDYGLSKSIISDHLKTAKIEAIKPKEGDAITKDLAKRLSAAVLDKAYLNEKQLDVLCENIYSDLKKEKISGTADTNKYDVTYNDLVTQLKAITKLAIKGIFKDTNRQEISTKNLTAKHLLDLSRFINDDIIIFEAVIRNYSDALEMKEKEGGGANDHFYSMMYLSADNELTPYAIVHNYETTDSKNDRLFSNENDLSLYTNAMMQINNTLNMSLRLRQTESVMKLDAKQKVALFQIGNSMINESTSLIDRIKALPEMLRELCKKNGEVKNATVFMVNKVMQENGNKNDDKNEMSIVGTTLKDESSKMFISDTVNLKEEEGKPITKLSGCVLKSKRILFIDKGDACVIETVGGKDRAVKLDLDDLPKELLGAKQSLIDMKAKKESNIIVPLLSGEKELGVIILSGDKLTVDDVNLLVQASNNIIMSTKNTMELNEKNQALSQVRKLNRELEVSSRTDDLTKLLRRKSFEEAMQGAIQKSKEFNYPVSVMMIDIDYFKSVNDKYGHQTGDKILVEISSEIKQFFKEEAEKAGEVDESIVGRYGGEEICVILPRYEKGEHQEGANGLGLKLLKYISSKNRVTHDGKPFDKDVTITIGISSFPEDVDKNAPKASEKAIDAADQALSAGKKYRNSCFTFNIDVGRKAEEEKRKQVEARIIVKQLIADAKTAYAAGDTEKGDQLATEAEAHMDLIR